MTFYFGYVGVVSVKIKLNEIPIYRDKFASEQNGRCWICQIELSSVVSCLDHSHITGMCRSVLCLNCNSMEGKIFNLARRGKRKKTEIEYLAKILEYWKFHLENPRDIMHPTHKTPDEKRLRKNKKARDRRKRLT